MSFRGDPEVVLVCPTEGVDGTVSNFFGYLRYRTVSEEPFCIFHSFCVSVFDKTASVGFFEAFFKMKLAVGKKQREIVQ